MSINVQLTYDWVVKKFIGSEFSKCQFHDEYMINILIHNEIDKYYLNKTIADISKPPISRLVCESVNKDERVISVYDDIEVLYRPVEIPGFYYDPPKMLTVKSIKLFEYTEKIEKFK
jgi:hypothetical protein